MSGGVTWKVANRARIYWVNKTRGKTERTRKYLAKKKKKDLKLYSFTIYVFFLKSFGHSFINDDSRVLAQTSRRTARVDAGQPGWTQADF